MAEGVEGLTLDKTRKSGKKPLPATSQARESEGRDARMCISGAKMNQIESLSYIPSRPFTCPELRVRPETSSMIA